MAVALDTKMNAGNSTDGLNQRASAATTISSSGGITVGASATLLLALLSLGEGSIVTPPTLSGVTWNGVAMTQILSILSSAGGGGAFSIAAIYALLSPASGANVLTANWDVTSDCYMSAISFTGTDTSTGVQVADNASATQATSLNITSASGDATVAVFTCDGGAPTVNFTEIFSEAPLNPGGGANYTLGGTTNNHTFSGAGGTRQAIAGVHVLASGGGGGGGGKPEYYYRGLRVA